MQDQKEKVQKNTIPSTLTTEDFYILLFGKNSTSQKAGFLMLKEWWVNLRQDFVLVNSFFESLILAQDECWRRALSMQVKGGSQESTGGRVSNAWVSTLKWDIASRKVG